MLSWLFKRGIDSRFEKVHSSIHGSFKNVKEDISQISHWINHFKKKHDSHDENIGLILKRLQALESHISSNSYIYEEPITEVENEEELNDLDQRNWNELTDVQQHLAWVALSLDKEEPKTWHSLKKIALELYPNREYSEVRTTISHYVRLLEEFGIVERKRIGNQSLLRIKKIKLPKLRIEKSILNQLITPTKKGKKRK